jgi:hypothetical protein
MPCLIQLSMKITCSCNTSLVFFQLFAICVIKKNKVIQAILHTQALQPGIKAIGPISQSFLQLIQPTF